MNFLLNRRITICMLFIALSLLGYVSYKQLPVELLCRASGIVYPSVVAAGYGPFVCGVGSDNSA